MAAVDSVNDIAHKVASVDLDGLSASSRDAPEDGQKTPHAALKPSNLPEQPNSTEQMTCPFSGRAMPASDDASQPPPSCPASHIASPSTQEVDPELLRTSLEDRMAYLTDFLGFGKKQQEIIHKVAPMVNEAIPDVVDGLYSKLFEFDVTKQVFMERNEGFDGPLPTKLEDLSLESPQLVYRKIFMKAWARRVLTSDYSNGKTWAYMDKVGIMHTGVKSFKHRAHVSPLVVPYRDCALSLGWVLTVLQTAILQLPEEKLSMGEKIEAVAAINKVIWIQNDLFARHYINE